jgi:trehalose synthase
LVRPREVHLAPLSPNRYRELLDDEDWERFRSGLDEARRLLEGRVVWNVNSTAAGGGVAEMLRSLVSYSRGAGVDVRWIVIAGNPGFFTVTKRLHNHLHGYPGDGGELGEAERTLYEAVATENAEELAAVVRAQDIVILHDPQTAGLTAPLKDMGAIVAWRSHIGAEHPDELVRRAWDFLAPYLERADACIFSRRAYVPAWSHPLKAVVIAPSIDAFSPKNHEMDPATVRAILIHIGLLDGRGVSADGVLPTFVRHDGSPGRVDHLCDVMSTGPAPEPETPLVVQASRWDRLKDPIGVMLGFADHVADETDAHLVLAGPAVDAVADDPEGARVLDEAETAWRSLPPHHRSRIHLACLPMLDIEENAAMVNALQRHATVVVQKSIQEGFGLTVAEAMWKSRPVVASAVGGIQDQIEDGLSGMLLQDPGDLRVFGETTIRLLNDAALARLIGRNARERVRTHFLHNRHALQYIELFKQLLG